MKNFVQPGEMLLLTMPVAVSSGDPVMVGSIFAVAATDGAIGADVVCAVTGVFELPKAAGVVAQGAPMFWDAAAKKLTTDDDEGDNPRVGAAIKAALSGAAIVAVRLNG